MKLKKINYIKYLIELSIIFILILGIKNSSYKTESYSSNENVNKSVNLTTMSLFINKEEALKKEEERKAKIAKEQKEKENLQKYLYDSLDSYTGSLTGYGADCPMCSGRLACNSSIDLSNGKNTYNDKKYGKVNIVASSKNLSCGTIIRFNNKKISNKPIIAIVLDRGVLGNDIDLLAPSNDYAAKYIGRSTITYDVLRHGWEK